MVIQQNDFIIHMKKKIFKQLVKECVREVYSGQNDYMENSEYSHKPQMRVRSDEPSDFNNSSDEMELPPGFTQTVIQDVPEKPTDELQFEANEVPGRDVPDAELDAYLDRVRSKTKSETDKLDYPYIHRSNILDDGGNPIDRESLKKEIMQRPATILKQNAKIQKSGGVNYVFFNIGLPAIKGLVVDEKTGKFKIIDTCPGAGECKKFCYARKGGYVQFKRASMMSTRLLNFLVNDWDGFKNKLIGELKQQEEVYSKKNTKVIVRWHDSGDFFSPDYLKVAFEIAESLPNIIFYAYTKIASASSGKKPKNFVMNFSKGAAPEQEKQVDTKKQKHSVVVPKQMFSDLSRKVGDDEYDKKLEWNSLQDLDKFKEKMSMKYGIDKKSIITYKELMSIPYNPNDENIVPKYNVVVVSGDGDDAAMRKDVIGTYLLQH